MNYEQTLAALLAVMGHTVHVQVVLTGGSGRRLIATLHGDIEQAGAADMSAFGFGAGETIGFYLRRGRVDHRFGFSSASETLSREMWTETRSRTS